MKVVCRRPLANQAWVAIELVLQSDKKNCFLAEEK